MDNRPCQGIHERRVTTCPDAPSLNISELINVCGKCHRFFMRCCQHPDVVCHYFPMIFVHGLCCHNAPMNPKVGVGITWGTTMENHLCVYHANAPDNIWIRSNLRAQLLAVLTALRELPDIPHFTVDRPPVRVGGPFGTRIDQRSKDNGLKSNKYDRKPNENSPQQKPEDPKLNKDGPKMKEPSLKLHLNSHTLENKMNCIIATISHDVADSLTKRLPYWKVCLQPPCNDLSDPSDRNTASGLLVISRFTVGT
jgi:hypothetical protein